MRLRRQLWLALLIGLLILVLWLPRLWLKEQPVEVACPDIVAGCRLPQAGLTVQFDRHPRPMQEFHVRVELPGTREVHASFSMRDMEMGLNRYRLLPDGQGSWHAAVILPACVQGRQDWLLVLEADGRRYELPFTSD